MIYGSLLGSVSLGGFLSKITLTAQNMTITPAATPGPCYDPCTVIVNVIWVNNTSGTLPSGQLIGITVDNVAPLNGSATTTVPIGIGETISHTFTVTGLMHNATNLICPVPN